MSGNICSGCGAKLQSSDLNLPGYVPQKFLNKVEESEKQLTCRRCYRVKHYGEIERVSADAFDMGVLHEISGTDSLVVLVVDFLDLASSLEACKYIGKRNRLLLLINKIDLLPEYIKLDKVEEFVQNQLRAWKLSAVQILCCSGVTGQNIDLVAAAIEAHRNALDVYVIGVTNMGKSTLLNRLLAMYGDEQSANLGSEVGITTSSYSGTTLRAIPVELDSDSAIIDTPGVMHGDRYANWLEFKQLQEVLPIKRIQPRVYQLNEGQTLMFGGLARIDILHGEKQSYSCYMANQLYIHRGKTTSADQYYATHYSGKFPDLPPMRKTILKLSGKEAQDIVIPGLGWIRCGKKASTLAITVPQKLNFSLRSSVC